MGLIDSLANLLKGKSDQPNPPEKQEEQPSQEQPPNVIDFEIYKASAEVVACRYLTKKEKQAILSANLSANHMKGNVIEAIQRGIEYD